MSAVAIKWLYSYFNHVQWYGTQWNETVRLQHYAATYNL